MGKGTTPADPMAAAKARWAASPGARWQTFEAARNECEALATEAGALVAGLKVDPLLGLERRSTTEVKKPSGGRRVAIEYEANIRRFADRYIERLSSPDVDLWGMVVAADLLRAVVNSLGDRMEDPAIRGAKSKLGSKKGGRGKKRGADLTADNRRDEVIIALKAMGLRSSKLSLRNIANRIGKKIGVPAETVRNDLRNLKQNKRI